MSSLLGDWAEDGPPGRPGEDGGDECETTLVCEWLDNERLESEWGM